MLKKLSFEEIQEKINHLDEETNKQDLIDFLFQKPLPVTTEAFTILKVLKKLDDEALFSIFQLQHLGPDKKYFIHHIVSVPSDKTIKMLFNRLEKTGKFEEIFNLLELREKKLYTPLHYIVARQGPLANGQWISLFNRLLENNVNPKRIFYTLNMKSFTLESILGRFFNKQNDEMIKSMFSLFFKLLEKRADPKEMLTLFVNRNVQGVAPIHLITFLKDEKINRQWFSLLVKLLGKGVAAQGIIDALTLSTKNNVTPLHLIAGRRTLPVINEKYLLLFDFLLIQGASFINFFNALYSSVNNSNQSFFHIFAREQSPDLNQKLLEFLEKLFKNIKKEDEVLSFIKMLGIVTPDKFTYFNASRHRIQKKPLFRIHEKNKIKFAETLLGTIVKKWLTPSNKQDVLVFLKILLQSGVGIAGYYFHTLNAQGDLNALYYGVTFGCRQSLDELMKAENLKKCTLEDVEDIISVVIKFVQNQLEEAADISNDQKISREKSIENMMCYLETLIVGMEGQGQFQKLNAVYYLLGEQHRTLSLLLAEPQNDFHERVAHHWFSKVLSNNNRDRNFNRLLQEDYLLMSSFYESLLESAKSKKTKKYYEYCRNFCIACAKETLFDEKGFSQPEFGVIQMGVLTEQNINLVFENEELRQRLEEQEKQITVLKSQVPEKTTDERSTTKKQKCEVEEPSSQSLFFPRARSSLTLSELLNHKEDQNSSQVNDFDVPTESPTPEY